MALLFHLVWKSLYFDGFLEYLCRSRFPPGIIFGGGSFLGGSVGKNPTTNAEYTGDLASIPRQEDPRGRKWQPSLVFLPGKSNEQRSLMGYIVHRVAKSQTQLSNWTAEQKHYYYIANNLANSQNNFLYHCSASLLMTNFLSFVWKCLYFAFIFEGYFN